MRGLLRRTPLVGLAARWLARRRYPTLFVVAAGALLLNLVIPDGLPFLDEILMAVVAAFLGSWQRERAEGERRGPPRAEGPG